MPKILVILECLTKWRATFPRFAFVRDFGAHNCQPTTKAQLEN